MCLEASMRRSLFPVLWTTLVLLVVSTHAAPVLADEPPGRLGFCFVYHDLPLWHQLAEEAGASTNRWQMSWYEVEARKGEFEFDVFDQRVEMDRAAGLEVHAILMGTPDWAATAGTTLAPRIRADVKKEPWTVRVLGEASTSASPPLNLDLPWNHPDNYWGRFVYRTVSHMSDRVQVWEIWNEEDWSFFWTGSAADYYKLLKVGYLAAKAADPGCTVLFGGLHLFANPDFFQEVLELARQDPSAADHSYYLDAMPLHLYSRSSQAYDNVAWVRWRMQLKGIVKPIWINETGAPVWDDGVGPGYRYEWSVTAEEQAAYLIQAYANALAAGVERMAVFRLHDADMWEAYGMVRNNASRRPAFAAFQTVNTYLQDPEWVSRSSGGGKVVVTLYGAAQGKVTVLWNERPEVSSHTLTAIMDSALAIDPAGHTAIIYPENGQYTIRLPGATAYRASDPNDYIVGGIPVILVEPDTVPPQAGVEPMPLFSEQLPFSVSWAGSDDASGVWNYDVQVRDGADGAWTNLRTWTAQTSLLFDGEEGHAYYFRARARDRAGNTGLYPVDPQAWTTVRLGTPTPTATSTLPPTHTSTPLPTATFTLPPTHTSTPLPTATFTPLPTHTPTPLPTATFTPPPSHTPPPVATPTGTSVPATVTPGPCAELAANGGFEVDAGWTFADTPIRAQYIASPVHAGERALQLGIPAGWDNVFGYSTVEQPLTLPQGATIALDLWVYVPEGGGRGDYGYLILRPEGGMWRVLHVLRSATGGWTQLRADLSPYAGTVATLRLGVRNDGNWDGGAAAMYVDDLSVQACPP
jgi:hypothetical protein